MSATDHRRRSDRERAGLRGPVRSVLQGSTRWDYDRDGRLVSCRWLVQPTSEASAAVETWTYDNSGRLLNNTVRHADGSSKERRYSYDGLGRLLKIAEDNGDQTSFEYPKQAGKTEIRIMARRAEHPNAATAIGIDAAFADVEGDFELSYSRSGNANRLQTIYDEHDDPTETKAFSDDHLLKRIVRTYDDQHRITEVRVILDDPLSVFPGIAEEMVTQSGVPAREIREQLRNAIAPIMGESSKLHSYDSDGRLTKTVLRSGLMGETTRMYSYNDHGDVVEEYTCFTSPPIPVGVPFQLDEAGKAVPEKSPSEWPQQPAFPESSVVRYDYAYDSRGNWTEKRSIYSKESVHTQIRELTYH